MDWRMNLLLSRQADIESVFANKRHIRTSVLRNFHETIGIPVSDAIFLGRSFCCIPLLRRTDPPRHGTLLKHHLQSCEAISVRKRRETGTRCWSVRLSSSGAPDSCARNRNATSMTQLARTLHEIVLSSEFSHRSIKHECRATGNAAMRGRRVVHMNELLGRS